MPSLSEGLPVALIEVMFSGKPIVASAVGGIPEAVTTGQHTLLTPPGDQAALAAALERLLTDPPYRDALGRAARSRATERFSLDTMVDSYERLYYGGSSGLI